MSSLLHNALLIGTVLCIVANAVETVAKAMRARFVLENSAAVGLDERWLPSLAVLEGLGVAGLVLGLLWIPPLGLAAAVGLVLFFVVAIVVHCRARVLSNLAFPSTFLVLAVAATGYFAVYGG
ncbi:DoxX-like protein [Stackebrandtia endophytica]|uniref:DoxX-like protein n=1 Tax=Stackebrandtia endophytica TaxID=1496996 RepID=A0A543ARG7_9ACTN|nr:DoxX family protein [Stackebrandtia endophytica]TQL75169.1 DoxX-like protein [Stackebrandtia endophytica]